METRTVLMGSFGALGSVFSGLIPDEYKSNFLSMIALFLDAPQILPKD
jgi:hypothetical protein